MLSGIAPLQGTTKTRSFRPFCDYDYIKVISNSWIWYEKRLAIVSRPVGNGSGLKLMQVCLAFFSAEHERTEKQREHRVSKADHYHYLLVPQCHSY
jgi:hypothetical protein